MADASDVQQHGPLADPRRNPFEASPWGELGGELTRERTDVGARLRRKSFELVERAIQALALDGFQQVIDGIHGERVERVLVERCGENDERIRFELLEELETGERRHLDVEKYDVDRVRVEKRQRRFGIRRAP